jgi:hypothetical protein
MDIINVLAHRTTGSSGTAAHDMHLLPRPIQPLCRQALPDYLSERRDFKHLYTSEMWGWERQDNLWSGK